ncbi:hypothetical protein HYPSUDRAFT_40046 [Hypholoma sublateritium FD-334 SS-4]|uniref:ATP-dependent DNA helicase n=1 Tax=Hypholoma sublateritium (strain FD-334 SS-4) TaxID=945553 RepID=A0A0D2L7V5_HYPSF|nr:hypothetical protein HYPSUDRAFT_40046 [Hypholoma sublateritium FD-334 SS-4]
MLSDSDSDTGNFSESPRKPSKSFDIDLTVDLESDSLATRSSSSRTKGNSREHKVKNLPIKDVSECTRVLHEVFGFSDFKGKQKEIVEAAYLGSDALVVAPTGMGKSLCFQIPAIADKRGISIVVSPLLALMQNQIDSLRQKNVEVASLSSQVGYSEQHEITRQLQLLDPPMKLFYTTPERLCTSEFKKILRTVHKNHNFNRLVVDEAHCISEWGHDFREEYRRIGEIRKQFPDVPIMALTATATDAVREDIIDSLGLDKGRLFLALHQFNRPNLFYEVRYLSSPQSHNQMSEIFDYIMTFYNRRGKPSTGLVYCRMRKTCDELSAFLRGKGLNARPYHRGIPSGALEKTLKGWTKNEPGEPDAVDLVVATVAFGMGIDKGDVRYIIHYDLPKSLEGYYQETGRAGRDGLPAKCILYYSREDSLRVKQFVRNSDPHRVGKNGKSPTHDQRASLSLEMLIKFAENIKTCRHVSICRYFGEIIDDTNSESLKTYCERMCDVCKYPDKTKSRITKLSTIDDARNNVPRRQDNIVPQGSTKARERGADTEGEPFVSSKDSYGQQTYGAQKRSGPDYPENFPKKSKIALAPALVTKPHKSAPGLTKPFKAPTCVRPQAKTLPHALPPTLAQPKPQAEAPQAIPRSLVSRPLISDIDDNMNGNLVQTEDRGVSPALDLPLVELFWDPEHSAKVSVGDRRKQFESLRRSLHRIFTEPINYLFYWEKLSDSELDEDQRNGVLFNAAVELELSALSLSSTLDGYTCRVSSIKDDIKSLFHNGVWDSKDDDVQDVQEVIASLRRCLPSRSKGKGKQRSS